MTSRPDLAAVVEQALADVLPNCMRPEQLHRVEPLDLDTAEASIALDPEQFAGDLGKPPLLDGQPRPPGGARVPEKGVPGIRRVKRCPKGDRRSWGSAAGCWPAFPSAWGSAYATVRVGHP